VNLIIDMNLSPSWTDVFRRAGWQAEHWSKIGVPSASDATVLEAARDRGAVVFTHDLDFGRLLALTHAEGPSVVQVRTSNVTPEAIGDLVVSALRQSLVDLNAGALLTIDAATRRTRVLPLKG
jgi:predicted nuclease of predicted toxin-antitoxin system